MTFWKGQLVQWTCLPTLREQCINFHVLRLHEKKACQQLEPWHAGVCLLCLYHFCAHALIDDEDRSAASILLHSFLYIYIPYMLILLYSVYYPILFVHICAHYSELASASTNGFLHCTRLRKYVSAPRLTELAITSETGPLPRATFAMGELTIVTTSGSPKFWEKKIFVHCSLATRALRRESNSNCLNASCHLTIKFRRLWEIVTLCGENTLRNCMLFCHQNTLQNCMRCFMSNIHTVLCRFAFSTLKN